LESAQQKLVGQNGYLRRQSKQNAMGMIGTSKAIQAVMESIQLVRDVRVPVLIRGETGTGKELVARALHDTGHRSENLFVAQNCSAMSENLLESELFGHVKGAFTGANQNKQGLFELADGGTIFLDELGEMPPLLQAKLLRVLQEGEIWPVGAAGPKKVDVRVVSATHRDLEKMVSDGTFRQDLFFRLNVFPLDIPPLRERRTDIPLLIKHFTARYAEEFCRPPVEFSQEALATLNAYDWPGNIRELQNEVQRLLIIGPTPSVTHRHLHPRISGQTPVDTPLPAQGKLKDVMEAFERRFLMRALDEHGSNKTKTAEALGITREGLHKKLNRHGL